MFRDLMNRWRHRVHNANKPKLGLAQQRYTGLMGSRTGGLWDSSPADDIDSEVLAWEDFFSLDLSNGGMPDILKSFLAFQYLESRMRKEVIDASLKSKFSAQREALEEVALEMWTSHSIRVKAATEAMAG